MKHHSIVNQRLNIAYRETPLALMGETSCHNDGRDEVACECLFLPKLAMNEPRELLAISQQEPNLIFRHVDVHGVLCKHLCVSGEEHLPSLNYLARPHVVNNDNTHGFVARAIRCPTM